MPRVGKIHLGVRVPNSSGQGDHPKATDHFVCPTSVIEALRGKVPFCECKQDPGPTMLPIMFVTDDLDQALSDSFRAYKASTGLICKGDGYTADALLDADALDKRKGDVSQPLPVTLWAGSQAKRSVRVNVECWGEGYDGKPPCPLYAAKGCKKMMMPQFAIIEAPGIGVYQLDTGSKIGMENAYGFLRFLQTLTGGRVSGIPLQLHIVPQEVAPDGKKKTIHIIKLEAGFSLMDLAERLKQPPMMALLPPPDEEDLAEFYEEAKSVEGEVIDPDAPEAEQRDEAPAAPPDDAPPTNGAERPLTRAPVPMTDSQRKGIRAGLNELFGKDERTACLWMAGVMPKALNASQTEIHLTPLDGREAAEISRAINQEKAKRKDPEPAQATWQRAP
jgi:hypothetical protein